MALPSAGYGIQAPPPEPTNGYDPYQSPFGPTVSPQADGSSIVNLEPDAPADQTAAKVDPNDHNANLASLFEEGTLTSWADELLEGIEADLKSREDWEGDYRNGLKLLGLKIEEQTDSKEPPKVTHPLMLEALLNFQANASGEMLPAEGPVKTETLHGAGEQDDDAADRVQTAMNFFLTETDKSYYPDFSRMLWHIGTDGCAFKKVYTDPLRNRPTAAFVRSSDLIVPFLATSFETAARVTHRIPMRKSDLRRSQLAGFYRDIRLQDPQQEITESQEAEAEAAGRSPDWLEGVDDEYTLYEVTCERDLGATLMQKLGIQAPERLPLPWIVTIDKDSRKVLRVCRGWRKPAPGSPADPTFERRRIFVKYAYVPGFGFYDLGLIHLCGNPTLAATAILRQSVHAGQFHNFPGLVTNADLKGDASGNMTLRIGPGEVGKIDTAGQPIGEAVMPIPYNELSPVFLALLDKIVEAGRRIGGTAEPAVGEGRQDVAMGTQLALIEAATKVMTAVQKRLHVSQREEFAALKDLFAEDPDSVWPFHTKTAKGQAMGADFANVNVLPVSDPNTPSQMQRLVRGDALMQDAQQNPDIVNKRAVLLRRWQIIGIPDPEELLNPPPAQAVPMDPASENAAVLQGAPLKADVMQDHFAHIQVHEGFLTMPLVAAMPNAQPAIVAHIAEHLGLWYRREIEAQIGQPLPPPGQPMPPQIEAQLAPAMVQASDAIHAKLADAVGVPGISKEQIAMMGLNIKQATLDFQKQKASTDNTTKLTVESLRAADREQERASRERIARISASGRNSS